MVSSSAIVDLGSSPELAPGDDGDVVASPRGRFFCPGNFFFFFFFFFFRVVVVLFVVRAVVVVVVVQKRERKAMCKVSGKEEDLFV